MRVVAYSCRVGEMADRLVEVEFAEKPRRASKPLYAVENCVRKG